MSNGSTFVSPHCWTNNVRQFDPSLSNAIKETKPKVRRVFTLCHRATLGFMVNLLDFIKHLFRDGEMNFLRDISETTQCQQECQLTERTVEKGNLSEQKLGCLTVKARVDVASIKRYSLLLGLEYE